MGPLVFFADAHADDGAWANAAVKGDAYFALEQIFTWAIAHKAEALISAGDGIDHSRNRSRPIAEWMRQCQRLQDSLPATPVYFIQGQHDMDDPPWLAQHPLCRHLHRQTAAFPAHGVVLYGLDYQPTDKLAAALREIPPAANLLVAHQVWDEMKAAQAVPQGAFKDLPASLKYLVTGDFHRTVKLTKHTNAGGKKLTVFSPGSTCLQSTDEPDAKSFLVLWPGHPARFETVALMTRPIQRLQLATDNDLAVALDGLVATLTRLRAQAEQAGLPATVQAPLVVVHAAHDLDQAETRLKLAVREAGAHLFFYELPPDEEQQAVRRKLKTKTKRGEAVSLRSCLADELDPREDADAHALAVRLLESPDWERDLLAWKKDYLHVAQRN